MKVPSFMFQLLQYPAGSIKLNNYFCQSIFFFLYIFLALSMIMAESIPSDRIDSFAHIIKEADNFRASGLSIFS